MRKIILIKPVNLVDVHVKFAAEKASGLKGRLYLYIKEISSSTNYSVILSQYHYIMVRLWLWFDTLDCKLAELAIRDLVK